MVDIIDEIKKHYLNDIFDTLNLEKFEIDETKNVDLLYDEIQTLIK